VENKTISPMQNCFNGHFSHSPRLAGLPTEGFAAHFLRARCSSRCPTNYLVAL